jgi:hypothetical protein
MLWQVGTSTTKFLTLNTLVQSPPPLPLILALHPHPQLTTNPQAAVAVRAVEIKQPRAVQLCLLLLPLLLQAQPP